MSDFLFNASAAGIGLTEFARERQECLAQSMLAIHGDQVCDDPLLLANARSQVMHKAFNQRIPTQVAKEAPAGNSLHSSIFHRHCRFLTSTRACQTQFSEGIAGSVNSQQALFPFG